MVYVLFIIAHSLIALGLIGVVLIQSGRGGGLSGAFGLGEGQAVFGSRAGDVLTKATTWFAVLFMALCLLVTYLSKHADESIMADHGGASTAGAGRRAPLMTVAEREQAEATNRAATAATAVLDESTTGQVSGTSSPAATTE